MAYLAYLQPKNLKAAQTSVCLGPSPAQFWTHFHFVFVLGGPFFFGCATRFLQVLLPQVPKGPDSRHLVAVRRHAGAVLVRGGDGRGWARCSKANLRLVSAQVVEQEWVIPMFRQSGLGSVALHDSVSPLGFQPRCSQDNQKHDSDSYSCPEGELTLKVIAEAGSWE